MGNNPSGMKKNASSAMAFSPSFDLNPSSSVANASHAAVEMIASAPIFARKRKEIVVTPEDWEKANNGTFPFNLAHLQEDHPYCPLTLVSLCQSYSSRREQKHLGAALPRIVQLSRSTKQLIQQPALQFLSSYSFGASKKASFLVDDGVLDTCIGVLKYSITSVGVSESLVDVVTLLMTNLLAIGERAAVQKRITADIHTVLEKVCRQYKTDSLTAAALQCSCLASKFYSMPPSLLHLMEEFMTQRPMAMRTFTINLFDVKRIFLSKEPTVLRYALFMISTAQLQDDCDWDSISYLISEAIKFLRQDGKSTQLINAALQKLEALAPSLRSMLSEEEIDVPTILKLLIAGEVYLRLMDLGYPEEFIVQVLDEATLDEVRDLDLMRERVTKLCKANDSKKARTPLEELHSITFQLGDRCEPAPTFTNSFRERLELIEKIRMIFDIRRRPPDEVVLITLVAPRLVVKRDRALDTGLVFFNAISDENCRKPLFILFEGEQGLDFGGVKREFVNLICNEIEADQRKRKRKIFIFDDALGCAYPSPLANIDDFFALGRILGYAIVHNVPMPIRLSKALFKLLQGQKLTFNDLDLISDGFIKTRVEWLWNHDIELVGEINYELDYGEDSIPLIKNGGEVLVTEANKQQYIKDMVASKLGESIRPHLRAFASGVYDFVPIQVWRAYTVDEWSTIIHGEAFKLDDIKKAVTYVNCDVNHRVIGWFWTIVELYHPEDLMRLMNRWTSLQAQPRTDFELRIKLMTDQVSTAAVSASTCALELKLPPSKTMTELEVSMSYFMGAEGELFTDS
eukprot:TRINITY_DN1223_c0_g2_i1.p1 TRINITY_DN1223_c0_g2~~TRINITY_DN1223_c0_g2_i1.p1  ORF type:complete len:800 (-),score=208.47 TRINITY_DN1223_c0_g2_i1:217-2616(-)